MKFNKILLIVLLICSLSLTGCMNSHEIDKLAIVTSFGFDKVPDGIMVTAQILNPRAIATQKAINEPSVFIYTEKGKDVYEIIRKLSKQTSRMTTGTHLSTIVFGEDFARSGISDVLEFLTRERQNGMNLYFIVAKGTTANSFLSVLTKLNPIPADKIYESINTSESVWGATKSVRTLDLVNSIIADGDNPVIAGAVISEDYKNLQSTDGLKQINSGGLKLESLGVFKKDKLAGWFNEDESLGYNYIKSNIKSSIFYVEDKEIGKITLRVENINSKQTAYLSDGKPAINVNIKVTTNILTVSGGLDVTKEENLAKIKKLAEEKFTGFCRNSVIAAQQNIGSDPFGFGETIHRSYPILWTSLKKDWNNTFKKLPVNISVNINIIGTGAITKSYFSKENQ